MQPLQPEAIESHTSAYQLITEIVHVFGIPKIQEALPSILNHALTVVQSQVDFSLNSSIFPLLTALSKLTESPEIIFPLLEPFIPCLDSLVFSYSEYVDVKLPSVEDEFGSLGSAFTAGESDDFYRIVRADNERVQCKAIALETLLRISFLKQKTVGMSMDDLDHLASIIVSLCQHSSETIRHYAVFTELSVFCRSSRLRS